MLRALNQPDKAQNHVISLTLVRDTEQKVTDADSSVEATRGGGERAREGQGGQYVVTEADLTVGGGHTMQHADHVSWKNVHVKPTRPHEPMSPQ